MVAEPLRVAKTEPEEQEEVQPWRVGREDFYRIAELGVFGENRVEWLDGQIFLAPPSGGVHGTRSDRLMRILVRGLGDDWVLRNQTGLICPRAELAPDFSLVPSAEYRENETPMTATLVIEIAVSSLRYDRDVKAAHYAEAKVSYYWILDLEHRKILVFEDPIPKEARYQTLRTLGEDDSLTIPGTDLTLTGKELLG